MYHKKTYVGHKSEFSIEASCVNPIKCLQETTWLIVF